MCVCVCVVCVCVCVQTSRELHKLIFAAYVELKAAFDSVDRQVLWQLLLALDLPRKVVRMIETFYTNTESCVRVDGKTSDSFQPGEVMGAARMRASTRLI